jgi:D-hydroxyproline dehydrogenase subunit alpha
VLFVAEQAATSAVAGFAAGLWRRPAMLIQAMRHRAAFARTPYRTGMWVSAARGEGRLEEVTLTDGGRQRTVACDLLCAAYGLLPNTQLPRLLGCHVDGGATVVDEHQQTSILGVYAVGESTGVGGVDLALLEGEIAALTIAGDERATRVLVSRHDELATTAVAMERAFALRDELRHVCTPNTVVCRCEDATLGAMDARWSTRQAKLYTRAGMGPCQGRICGPALEFIFGWPADRVRVPAEPALISTLLAEAAEPAVDPHLQGASR